MAAKLEALHTSLQRQNPGLDVIFVHGVRTLSNPGLQNNWRRELLDLGTKNASLYAYDVHINAERALTEASFQHGCSELYSQLVQHSVASENCTVLVGYALAGLLIKEVLWSLSRADKDGHIREKIKGLVFIATPHFKDSATSKAQLLGIIQYVQSAEKVPHASCDIQEASLDALIASSRQFEELKLSCRVLSVYEQFEMYYASLIKLNKRRVQMVTKKLATTNAVHEEFQELDVKLSHALRTNKSDVPRQIRFLVEGVQADLSSLASIAILESRLSTVALGATPDSSLASPSSLSTPESISPSQHSASARSRSSEESLMFVLDQREWEVPEGVTYIQNLTYEQPNTKFKGRQKLLDEMDKALLPVSTPKTSVAPQIYILHGPAGIGKTQVAAQYFHTRRANFDAAFWVQATSSDNLSIAFNHISEKLRMYHRGSNQPATITPQRETHVIEWLRHPLQSSTKQSKMLTWLLVFDNADEPDILQAFWPHNAPGSVIVTTRLAAMQDSAIVGNDGTQSAKLDPSETSHAVQLLKAKIPDDLLQYETEESLQHVAQMLGRWPLYIVRMAGQMNYLQQTPTAFLQDCEPHDGPPRRYLEGGPPLQDGYQQRFLELWSFDEQPSAATRLLSVLSLLMPEEIPESILMCFPPNGQGISLQGYPINRVDYNFAVAELVQRSDVTQKRASSSLNQPGVIHVHSFIQDMVRSHLLKHPDQTRDTFNAVVELLLHVWPGETRPQHTYVEPNQKSQWVAKDELIKHLSRMRLMYKLLPGPDTKMMCGTKRFLLLLWEVGRYYFQRSKFDEAEEVVRTALQVYSTCRLEDPNGIAGQHELWAEIAMARNQAVTALEQSELALDIREKDCSPTNQLATAYATVGRALIMANRLEDAEAHIDESTKLRRALPGFSKLHLFTPLVYQGLIDYVNGKYADAVMRLNQALEDRLEKLGHDDREGKRTGHLYLFIGTLRGRLGQHERALTCHRQALRHVSDIVAEDDTERARVRYSIALDELALGSYKDAKSDIEMAIRIYFLSKYHQGEYARCLFLKHMILLKMKDNGGAKIALDESVEYRRQLMPTDTTLPETLTLEDFNRMLPIWFH